MFVFRISANHIEVKLVILELQEGDNGAQLKCISQNKAQKQEVVAQIKVEGQGICVHIKNLLKSVVKNKKTNMACMANIMGKIDDFISVSLFSLLYRLRVCVVGGSHGPLFYRSWVCFSVSFVPKARETT